MTGPLFTNQLNVWKSESLNEQRQLILKTGSVTTGKMSKKGDFQKSTSNFGKIDLINSLHWNLSMLNE